ncbi:MAG: DUF5685 family protein [Clostridia bacterium]|nr:DUF5685 family protein [Clostridia bacterium]
MFGYVNICESELKVGEYRRFRAYYCGLCKAIGKRASQLARCGLSYDMTFLALVLSAVNDENTVFDRETCFVHPIQKRLTAKPDEVLDYVAYMSVLLVYLKFADDWHDERSIKALLGMGAYFRAKEKAKRIYTEEYNEIKKLLANLSMLERKKSDDIDAAADCFAKILKILAVPKFIKDSNTRRILAWLGYNTGRWIYIIDAVNDIEKDIKKRNYNPILMKYPVGNYTLSEYKKLVAEKLEITLTFTLDNIASSYELLHIYRNDEILRNIIYLGLKMKQDFILGNSNAFEEAANESI